MFLLADALEAAKDEVAALESKDSGKPIECEFYIFSIGSSSAHNELMRHPCLSTRRVQARWR